MLNIWTRTGSEKAQSSQTIRILLRMLQYLAEDVVRAEDEANRFLDVTVPIIKNLFIPSRGLSINEQVQTFLATLGWKNVQIRTKSANHLEIILGNNRHLDQTDASSEGIRLLVKAVSKAVGYHLLDREVDALVTVDFNTGPAYTVEVKAIESGLKSGRTSKDKVVSKSADVRQPQTPPIQNQSVEVPTHSTSSQKIDVTQFLLPIVNSKLPQSTLFLQLQEVLVEFSKSWYEINPLDEQSSTDIMTNVLTLTEFLIEKSTEANREIKLVGNMVGRFLSTSIKESFGENPEDILSQEIIESETLTMVRDIKAMSLCNLSPGDKCIPANRAICDFAMGIYEGVLSTFTGKEYEFSSYFEAGKRDIYCLMEFQVKESS